MKLVLSRRSVTPSRRPVITRSPYGAAESGQAKLREGPVGRSSGSSCSQRGVPAATFAGSVHQPASTLPPSGPSGLKKIVAEACTSWRSPSIQMP